MKRSFADILGDVAALQRKKVEAKLPGWADVDGLEFAILVVHDDAGSRTLRVLAP